MFDNIFIEFFLKIFIFISIICVIHLLWEHLKNTYTKPKVKDLVNTQITKYKQIVEEININKDNINNSEEEFFENKDNIQDMNNDLLSYMNSQTQQFVTID